MVRTVNLAQRCREPEIMDQPGLDEQRHFHALRGLARINSWSGSARIVWPAIRSAAVAAGRRPLRVLDLATGAGDLPIRLWHKAQRAKLPIQFAGCDRSPAAINYADQRAQQSGAVINFFTSDVLEGPLPIGYDVMVSSLFLHHLEEDQAVALLRRMADAAGQLALINDLRRSRTGYLMAWLGTRLLTRSDVVHTDGPLSVAAAFTIPEVRALAERAGLHGAVVTPRWPCRLLLTFKKS